MWVRFTFLLIQFLVLARPYPKIDSTCFSCALSNFKQAKECEGVMEFPLGHFNILILDLMVYRCIQLSEPFYKKFLADSSESCLIILSSGTPSRSDNNEFT